VDEGNSATNSENCQGRAKNGRGKNGDLLLHWGNEKNKNTFKSKKKHLQRNEAFFFQQKKKGREAQVFFVCE